VLATSLVQPGAFEAFLVEASVGLSAWRKALGVEHDRAGADGARWRGWFGRLGSGVGLVVGQFNESPGDADLLAHDHGPADGRIEVAAFHGAGELAAGGLEFWLAWHWGPF